MNARNMQPIVSTRGSVVARNSWKTDTKHINDVLNDLAESTTMSPAREMEICENIGLFTNDNKNPNGKRNSFKPTALTERFCVEGLKGYVVRLDMVDEFIAMFRESFKLEDIRLEALGHYKQRAKTSYKFNREVAELIYKRDMKYANIFSSKLVEFINVNRKDPSINEEGRIRIEAARIANSGYGLDVTQVSPDPSILNYTAGE